MERADRPRARARPRACRREDRRRQLLGRRSWTWPGRSYRGPLAIDTSNRRVVGLGLLAAAAGAVQEGDADRAQDVAVRTARRDLDRCAARHDRLDVFRRRVHLEAVAPDFAAEADLDARDDAISEIGRRIEAVGRVVGEVVAELGSSTTGGVTESRVGREREVGRQLEAQADPGPNVTVD